MPPNETTEGNSRVATERLPISVGRQSRSRSLRGKLPVQG